MKTIDGMNDDDEMVDVITFDKHGAMCRNQITKCEFDRTNALQTLKEVEAAHIERVIAEAGGNISWAARILGIDRRTLYRKRAILRRAPK